MLPKVTAGIVAVLLAFIVVVHAQETKPAAAAAQVRVTPKTPYNADHGELLVERQKRAQSDELVLEMRYRQQLMQDPAYQRIVAEYNATEQELSAWINEVRKANGWDGTYNYDRTANVWTHTAPAQKPTNK